MVPKWRQLNVILQKDGWHAVIRCRDPRSKHIIAQASVSEPSAHAHPPARPRGTQFFYHVIHLTVHRFIVCRIQCKLYVNLAASAVLGRQDRICQARHRVRPLPANDDQQERDVRLVCVPHRVGRRRGADTHDGATHAHTNNTHTQTVSQHRSEREAPPRISYFGPVLHFRALSQRAVFGLI